MKRFLQKKVIKKVIMVFICASMVLSPLTETFLSNELKAEAAATEPNWYGGAYTAGVNVYAMSSWFGQCTWYAWGRAYELTGIKLPCRDDAHKWYSIAANNGYSVGAEPAENAIAVWSSGSSGHVAYVEAVSGENVIISQANATNPIYIPKSKIEQGIAQYDGRMQLTKAAMKVKYGTLLGYIYLTGNNSASAPVSASGTWKITATDGVNVRSGAGTGYNKVGFYAYNTVVTIYEKATANGYTWGHTSDGWFVLDYAEAVSSDSEAPIINARVSSLTNKSFTVSADISDNVAVTDIKIAVWTEANGQDDLHWYSCMDGLSGNSFTAWFDLDGYGYAEDTYNIHIYVYDAAGNESGYPLTAYLDTTAPKGGNVKVSNVSEDGYTITCTASDNVELDRVCFPTWTNKNGKDDLLEDWRTNPLTYGTISGDTVTYHVKISDHGNEMGTYLTDVYAFDKAGNETYLGNISQEITVNQEVPDKKTDIEKTDSSDTQSNKDNKEESSNSPVSDKPGTTDQGSNTIDGAGNTTENNDIDLKNSSIEFMEKQITIENGEEDDLGYQMNEAEETEDNTLIWSSSDTSVVTVEDGHIVAVNAGTAQITVTMTTGDSATCIVNVVDSNAITSISLEKTKLSLYVGDTEWLDYILEPEDADEDLLICTSSNSKVATIKDGIITGKSAGNAVITVKYGTLKATCNVTVKGVSLQLKKTSATIKAGKKVKIQATVTPKVKIKYSSSNKKIATVNAKGVVKAKRKGKAVIFVKANGVTKKFKVNVK